MIFQHHRRSREEVEIFFLDGPYRGQSKFELKADVFSSRSYLVYIPLPLSLAKIDEGKIYNAKVQKFEYYLYPIPPGLEGHERMVAFIDFGVR
jgi:hypothetical protein